MQRGTNHDVTRTGTEVVARALDLARAPRRHVVDDLAGNPDHITVTKRSWSAFHGTDRGVSR